MWDYTIGPEKTETPVQALSPPPLLSDSSIPPKFHFPHPSSLYSRLPPSQQTSFSSYFPDFSLPCPSLFRTFSPLPCTPFLFYPLPLSFFSGPSLLGTAPAPFFPSDSFYPFPSLAVSTLTFSSRAFVPGTLLQGLHWQDGAGLWQCVCVRSP